MSKNFSKFNETEKLNKAEQKTIQGGDIDSLEEEEGRKGKVA